MIDCNKKEDHKKCRQAHVDECLGKDLNKMCEARKALETRWADDVRPPIGTFSDQIDWAIGEIRRLRAANAELVEALEGSAHPALADDACMSFRHDFGLMTSEHQEILRETARFWLEAWGKAILTPSKAARDSISSTKKADPEEFIYFTDPCNGVWTVKRIEVAGKAEGRHG